MIFKYIKQHLGFFILACAIIAVYKTFDNFTSILGWFSTLAKLLTPFFISFAIAYLLYPMCRSIEGLLDKAKIPFIRKIRRGLAIFCVYLIVAVAIGIIISFLVPIALRSFADLISYLPILIPRIVSYVQDFNFYGIDAQTIINNIDVEKLVNQLDLTNVSKYAEGVMGVSSTLLNIVMGIIISVYILLDRHNLKQGFKRIVRLHVKPRTAMLAEKYLRSINTFVYKYIFCQLTDALIIFILMYVAFSLLGVKYAAALAAFLGLFNLIPYFGAIIAGVVTVVITAFTTSPTTALFAGITILVLQQLDANIINPALVKDQLSVKPFWVILGILIGEAFFGPLGIFFAAPVMALLKIMLDDYLAIKECGGIENMETVPESSHEPVESPEEDKTKENE